MADNNQNPVPPNAVPPAAGDSPTVKRMSVDGAAPAPDGMPRTSTVRLRPVQAQPGATPQATAESSSAAATLKSMTTRLSPNEIPKFNPSAQTIDLSLAGDASAANRPAPAPAPAGTTTPMPSFVDVPKTVKIRPLAGQSPAAETSQPQGSKKSKTSRIPLEPSTVPASESGTGSSGAPKTIKLRRPTDMTTIKMAVPTAAGAMASPDDANLSPTQKKTIRVKRPSAPITMTMGAETGEEDGSLASGTPRPVMFAPPVREGVTGPFIAVAALCIVTTIALIVVFSSEIFGPNASLTELSAGLPSVEINLPGKIIPAG